MRRPFIDRQPKVVRDLLNQAIEREGYANYEKLAKEFSRFGKGFTKSSIHRHAVKLQAFKQRARLESEIMTSFSDDARWLVSWAQSYPREAAKLVNKLKSTLQGRVNAQQL